MEPRNSYNKIESMLLLCPLPRPFTLVLLLQCLEARTLLLDLLLEAQAILRGDPVTAGVPSPEEGGAGF